MIKQSSIYAQNVDGRKSTHPIATFVQSKDIFPTIVSYGDVQETIEKDGDEIDKLFEYILSNKDVVKLIKSSDHTIAYK